MIIVIAIWIKDLLNELRHFFHRGVAVLNGYFRSRRRDIVFTSHRLLLLLYFLLLLLFLGLCAGAFASLCRCRLRRSNGGLLTTGSCFPGSHIHDRNIVIGLVMVIGVGRRSVVGCYSRRVPFWATRGSSGCHCGDDTDRYWLLFWWYMLLDGDVCCWIDKRGDG